MATYDYSGIQTLVNKKIPFYGTDVILTRIGSSGTWKKFYDPIDMKNKWRDGATIVDIPPAETIFTYNGSVVITDYETGEVDGTLIKMGDKLLLAIGIPEPAINDVLTIKSINYKYVNHIAIAPNGVPLLYKIQVRI